MVTTGKVNEPRFAVGDQPALLGHLAWVVPALRPLVAEHLTDNFGQLLPHLLMGDYERWAEGAVGQDEQSLTVLLAELDTAYSTGSEDVRGLISESFLEMLPEGEMPGSVLLFRLGPNLTAWLRRWRPLAMGMDQA